MEQFGWCVVCVLYFLIVCLVVIVLVGCCEVVDVIGWFVKIVEGVCSVMLVLLFEMFVGLWLLQVVVEEVVSGYVLFGEIVQVIDGVCVDLLLIFVWIVNEGQLIGLFVIDVVMVMGLIVMLFDMFDVMWLIVCIVFDEMCVSCDVLFVVGVVVVWMMECIVWFVVFVLVVEQFGGVQ